MSRPVMRAVAAPLLAVTLIGLALALAACGGDDAKERAAAAKDYAARVSQISTSTGNRLADLSDTSDYREAAAAATSTRSYATGIRDAAAQLRKATPPDSVRTLHGSLVKLYDQTAASLDALATRFAAASDPVELASGAQELSTQVQRYASQEQELRTAIERGLVQPTTPGGD